MEYKWKDGFFGHVKAEIAGKVCSELESQGQLTAKNLVAVSTPEDAPLHKLFEWDNNHAADLYREQQARVIISNIIFVPNSNDSKEISTRVFYHLPSENCYEHIETIVKSVDKTQEILNAAKNDLRIFKFKYASLVQLTKLMTVIDETLNEEDK